ncbi:MAG TPA: histidine phosphatase family protein [Ferrovibrio sp.]|uniref:SixA phosphatase family protein n=1 Tax=Ferrovibrio sp. TaxID=1917215 RepID=UPI002ED0B8E7
MLLLWLLRHAKSAWDDPERDDFSRPLSPHGKRACRLLARHIAERGLRPDLVLCSPAVRARQTWEGVAKGLAGDDRRPMAEIRFEPSLYMAAPPTLLALVRAVPAICRKVMLIGHNPGLEDFARQLTGSADRDTLLRLASKYPTGALAELTFPVESWSQIGPGGGFLASLTAPREIESK